MHSKFEIGMYEKLYDRYRNLSLTQYTSLLKIESPLCESIYMLYELL